MIKARKSLKHSLEKKSRRGFRGFPAATDCFSTALPPISLPRSLLPSFATNAASPIRSNDGSPRTSMCAVTQRLASKFLPSLREHRRQIRGSH